jgi:hypothetical protein
VWLLFDDDWWRRLVATKFQQRDEDARADLSAA